MAEENGRRRILVIRGGALGDLVLTIPLIRAARELWPAAMFELLGYSDTAQFLLDSGIVSRIHRVDSPCFAKLFSGTLAADDETAQWIRGFTDIIGVWRDPERNILRSVHSAGIRHYTHIEPIPPEGGKIHAADYMLEQFLSGTQKRMPKNEEAIWAPIPISDQLLTWAERYIRENLHIGAERLVVVHPGSGGRGRNRNWPPESFGRLIDRLRDCADTGVVIIRGPADEKAVRAASDACSANAPVASGMNTSQLSALLACSSCYVGNDSGVSHLSAGVGAPTVAIFGSTDSAVWSPRGKTVRALSPGEGKKSPEDISSIKVDDVIKAIEEIWI